MPQFFANAVLNTARSARSGGYTSPETPYLSGVIVHIEPNTPGPSTPEGAAITAMYYATADVGTDIVRGDLITSITTLFDGTPYPGSRPGPLQQQPAAPGAANLVLRVVDARPAAPVFLPYLELWIDYIEGGGPVHN